MIDLARAHRVDRLLAWRTDEVDGALRAEAMLDEVRVRELNRVLAGLQEHAVAALVFKGAALAHTHYAQSWLRPRLDADVLIPHSQRQAAFDALSEMGYRALPAVSGSVVSAQAAFAHIDALGTEHALDLHWRVSNPQVLADLPTFEELSARADTVVVRGQPMRVPSPTDALVLACVHRAAHHGLSDELLWLYDIHLIAERLTASDWLDLVTRAAASAVKALCRNGLERAVECFETPVPPEVLAGLDVSGGPPEPSAVFLRRDLRPIDRLAFEVAALGPVRGLRLLREHVLPPAAFMRERYGVRHAGLLPLLYAQRLVNGMSKWWKPIRPLPVDRSRSAGRSNNGSR